MSYQDTIKKRDFRTSALRIAVKRAQGLADSRNEPTYLIEGKNEFFIADDTDFRYIDDWGTRDWPMWAKEDHHAGKLNVIETFFPVDTFKGKEKRAEKLVEKMMKMSTDLQFEMSFDLNEICRDYPEVRQQMNLVESGAKHMYSLILHLQSEVRSAAKHHKENGQREIETNGPVVRTN